MMGSLLLVALAGGDARWAGGLSALAMLSAPAVLYPLARWKNAHVVSGSALFADTLKDGRRGRIQGLADGSVSFSSAAAGLASGLLLGTLGYDLIAWIGLALGAVPLAWSTRTGAARRNP
jgi:hypothetical protein